MNISLQRFVKRILGEAAVRLLSLTFVMALARRLGPESFGQYMSALAFSSLFAIGVDLGTNAILMRDVARYPENRTRILETSHTLKLLAMGLSYLALWGLTQWMPMDAAQKTLTRLLGVMVLIQIWADYAAGLLIGREEMGWEAILKVVVRAVGIGPGLIALLGGWPLLRVAQLLALGSAVSYLAGIYLLRKRFGHFGWQWDTPYLRTLVRASAPLWACAVFWIFYDNQDILILNYFHFPADQIGHFAGAAKILDVLRVYPVLLVGVFFPGLSRQARSERLVFERRFFKIAAVMGVSGIAIAGLVLALAPWIVRLFYDAAFDPSVTYLRWLLPAFIGIAINHLLTHALIALDHERHILLAAIAACASNAVLAFGLVPAFGPRGACWALIGSEAVFSVTLGILLRHAWRASRP